MSPHELKRVKNPGFFERLDSIVIDEISMVRADVLDNIDQSLRLNRDDDRLFGGVQMIFIGDLFQLPPVVASTEEQRYFNTVYHSPFFFSAHVFQEGFKLTFLELIEVYRQDERHFIALLESVRLGNAGPEVLEELNARVGASPGKEPYVSLTSRNAAAHRINREALSKLPDRGQVFPASVQGQFSSLLFPTEQLLILKVGAQVMFLRNDPLRRFVNGTLGIIHDFDDEAIIVQVQEADRLRYIKVERVEWEMIRYSQKLSEGDLSTETIGTFVQYPLRLAWAITIHKSQGKTFDNVAIDLAGGAFAHGQTYVALSRCRSLQGIILRAPIETQDILVDPRIIDFHRDLIR